MNAKIWNLKGEESLITGMTVKAIEDIANKSGAIRFELWGETFRLIRGEWTLMPNKEKSND